MSKKQKPVVAWFSKAKLRVLIEKYGLQICMFDKNRLILDWDGVEYQFRLRYGKIFLESIVIRSDVLVGNYEIHQEDIYDNWMHLRCC